ncbi:hypothetical protein [Streptomyces sp. NPDC026673]|uniref:hypothetical protein n=1 Tax=Streptomyces sp. NPDC026673 TaxID=3155724 RepID=UPI0033CBB8F2
MRTIRLLAAAALLFAVAPSPGAGGGPSPAAPVRLVPGPVTGREPGRTSGHPPRIRESAPAAGGTASAQPHGGAGRLPSGALAAGIAGLVLTAALVAARRPLLAAVRRRRRAALGRRLAADTRTPLLVRHALRELALAGRPGSPVRVRGVLAEPDRVLATVSACGPAPAPWTALTPTRWERTGLVPAEAAAPGAGPLPQLTRLGAVGRGQVLVNLARIGGVLSVLGDPAVARDTVIALVDGVLEGAPAGRTVVVAVGPGARDLPGPPAVVRVRSIRQIAALRGPAAPGVQAGLVVVLHRPDAEEARLLSGLAGPKGGGWTVLTVGHVPGARWRWYAAADGTVDAGVLGHRVVVPVRPSVRCRL